jgi:hypothetical protein
MAEGVVKERQTLALMTVVLRLIITTAGAERETAVTENASLP